MTGGFFAILDDIAMLLDDAALMGKVAAKKTAGILGDDLAVNTEKATGFQASRELAVLWAITKGSLLNKLIILPIAFLLSAFAPWLIAPILLLGGAYLSFEGVEKIYHLLVPQHESDTAETVDEAQKIASAVRTDFILSIEIIMIALGSVADASLMLQILIVSAIALLATVGVYGLVALLVRMDDAGFYLLELGDGRRTPTALFLRYSGLWLIRALPQVIRILGFIGTVAMLLVGGGLFLHHLEFAHHLLSFLPALLADLVAGLLVGSAVLGGVLLFHKLRRNA